MQPSFKLTPAAPPSLLSYRSDNERLWCGSLPGSLNFWSFRGSGLANRQMRCPVCRVSRAAVLGGKKTPKEQNSRKHGEMAVRNEPWGADDRAS